MTHRISGVVAILSTLVIALAVLTSSRPKVTHPSAAPSAGSSTIAFAGWVNGIYIYPDASNSPAGFVPDRAVREDPKCPGTARIVSERELRASGYYIDIPAWMPPGAVEREGIYAEACGTKVIVVSRQFELPQGQLIGLVLRPGARTAAFPAVARQIQAITVDNRPAVAVEPLTEGGSGNSAIFIHTNRGLLQVGAFDVPFTDLRKVAESMK